jgi:hypothetical protein
MIISEGKKLTASEIYGWIRGKYTCPEDGGDTFLRNVGSNHNYTAPDPRRRLYKCKKFWE